MGVSTGLGGVSEWRPWYRGEYWVPWVKDSGGVRWFQKKEMNEDQTWSISNFVLELYLLGIFQLQINGNSAQIG